MRKYACCYVYYQVAASEAATLLPKIKALQAHLAERYALEVSLHQRIDEKAQLTWMEVYQLTSADLSISELLHVLQQAAREADILHALHGERHHECFMEINPCA